MDNGDRMTQTTHATTKPISQLTFPLRRHPIYQPAQEHRISSMQVQLNSWGSQPCPRLYVCYVGESNNLKQLPTNQPSTPNIKYSRYVCMFLGMQAQKNCPRSNKLRTLRVWCYPNTQDNLLFFFFSSSSPLPLPVAVTSNKPETHPANWAGGYDMELAAHVCACVTPRTPCVLQQPHQQAHTPAHLHYHRTPLN